MLFFYPVSVGDLGVNYAFVLLPIFTIIFTGRISRPPASLLTLMAVFSVVFVVAAAYQVEYLDHSARRVASFLIFMGMFSYTFIEIDDGMTAAFKAATIATSLLMAARMIYTYFALGGNDLGFEAKNVVGTQRVGFIYLIALWLVYADRIAQSWRPVLRYGAMFALLVGLVLTFSRSSIVALLGSFALFVTVNVVRWLRRPRPRRLIKGAASVLSATLVVMALAYLVPVVFEFFKARLFDITAVAAHMENEEASEGIRIVLARKIVQYVVQNPVTGTGYLGIWIVPDARSGSAHNQYTDVLLRTGFFGAVAYLYLLGSLLLYLYRSERALFWGITGVLIYGMFHETFKEPQGGMIAAFLIGLMAQASRLRSPARAAGVAHTAPGGLSSVQASG